MVTSSADTVDAYLKEQAEAKRGVLSKIRLALRTELSGAAEAMEHGMPTYRLATKTWSFNAQKRYFAVYFSDFKVVAALAKRFPRLDCGKSCVRFRSFEEFALSDLRAALRASLR